VSAGLRRVLPEAATFLLVAAAYSLHFANSGYGRFYHDAEGYWELGERFGEDGPWLLSYDDRLRGYALPLINRGLQTVAAGLGLDDVTIVELTGALLAATLGVVVLPRLARVLFSDASIGWARVLALNALIFLFWRDHFAFPLSDFPAFLAACIGLLGMFRGTAMGYLVAGLGFGVAASIRPAYLPLAALGIAAAGLPLLRRADWRRGALASVIVGLGVVAVTTPQIAINHRHHDTWSPVPAGSRDIALVQLNAGLAAQRYETYVGPPDGYPRTRVFYLDPATRDLAENEISGYGEYARVALSHPHRIVASYVLHTFNGLDVRYPTPYVRDLTDSPGLLTILQYTVMFFAAMRLVLPEARRALGRIRWIGVLILAIPCVTAIPGALEPRFFLPLHMLAYMLVCFGPATIASLRPGGASRPVAIAGLYVLLLAVWLGLSAATEAQLEYPLD
jgi:hypothetical protein